MPIRVRRSEKEEKSGSRRGASLCEPRELLKFEPGSGDSDDVGRLGPLLSLRDFKLDRVALLQGAIAVANDARIVDENVWRVFASDEAVRSEERRVGKGWRVD